MLTLTIKDNLENISTSSYHKPDEHSTLGAFHKIDYVHSNPLGTFMLELLNCDIDTLEQAINIFLGADGDSEHIHLRNPSTVEFSQIKEQFVFMRIYSDITAYIDIAPSFPRGLREVKSEFIQVLQTLNSHAEYYNYEFLSSYLLQSILPSKLDLSPRVFEAKPRLDRSISYGCSQNSIETSFKIAFDHYNTAPLSSSIIYEYTFERHYLEAILYTSLLELVRRGKVIRKCKICGQWFIPENRSDTLYCDNPSPEAPEMTCKEYGTRRLWYERQKEDELATLSRKIASAKGMLAKRNPDIPAYAVSYEYFKAERMIWKKAVDEGRKTKEEYREWLLLMQSQKIIKEAIQGNNYE